MRLKHSTTAQDDASEATATAFVQQPSALALGSGRTGTPNEGGLEVEEFVRDFRDLRKVYHKRVIWGDKWTNGNVAWRDD